MWIIDSFRPFFPFFCRFGVQFTYFGICLNIAGFGLSLYLTQLTFACIEFPSKISVYFFVEKVGRRPSEMGALLLTGVCLFVNLIIAKGDVFFSFSQICPCSTYFQVLTIYSPLDKWIFRTVTAVLGKALSEASCANLYLYTTELFPTVVRWVKSDCCCADTTL